MINLEEYVFLLENFVVWAIFLVAVVAYALILDLSFFKTKHRPWVKSCNMWIPSLNKLLASLPLLGLLGTITGLMETFTSISRERGLAVEELITGGIAEAMYTTQLGLVLLVPGLLLLAQLKHKLHNWEATHRNEIQA